MKIKSCGLYRSGNIVFILVFSLLIGSTVASATTISPQIGIAVGKEDLMYQDQQYLDYFFQNLTDLGVTWVRWDLEWNGVQEFNSESYNWTGTDRVAKTAQKYGVNSLVIINRPPRWAIHDGSNFSHISEEDYVSKHYPPEYVEDFANFAKEVASRYKDDSIGYIGYFEIWNEPNLNGNWYPKSNATEYAVLLKSSYVEIKNANQDAIVISGGLAPASNEDGDISPITFVDSLYELDMGKYFDALALHPYSFPATPTYSADWNFWQQMDGHIREIIRLKDPGKRIWITEYGAPTGGTGSMFETSGWDEFSHSKDDYMSEDAQKEMMEQAIEYCNNNSDFIEMLFIFCLYDYDHKQYPDSRENYFGLIHLGSTKKPAYWVIKQALNTTSPVDNSPVAKFSSNVTEGSVPLSVQFTDISENATSWIWDFGDGNNSTEQNPTHVYNKEGTYIVSLNSSNSFGHSIETKDDYIIVSDWNPWNDPGSADGVSITLSELQTAIYNWKFRIALPNGEMIDINRLMELIYQWRFG